MMAKIAYITCLNLHRHARVQLSFGRLCPAMTNVAFWRNEPKASCGRTVFWQNEPKIVSTADGRPGETAVVTGRLD
jgi:hypothetical protein